MSLDILACYLSPILFVFAVTDAISHGANAKVGPSLSSINSVSDLRVLVSYPCVVERLSTSRDSMCLDACIYHPSPTTKSCGMTFIKRMTATALSPYLTPTPLPLPAEYPTIGFATGNCLAPSNAPFSALISALNIAASLLSPGFFFFLSSAITEG